MMVVITMLTHLNLLSVLLDQWQFKKALKKANPVILEPIMKIVVVTPENFMGDVIGDLNSKRGRIESYGRPNAWN